jgi:hypothetical protein
MGYSFSNKGSWRRLIESHASVGNLVGVNEQHKLVRAGHWSQSNRPMAMGFGVIKRSRTSHTGH